MSHLGGHEMPGRGTVARMSGVFDRRNLMSLALPMATLAVLLAWTARARRAGAALRFAGVPDDLRALAHLCDAEPLLGIA